MGMPSELLSEWRKKQNKQEPEFSPAATQMRALGLIKLLCKKPSGLQEIAETLDVSKRTAYRYLAMMTHLGFDVKVSNTGKYFFDKCPLCGK